MPKFLIIRFSSIGDIVLTTPVVRCLKSQIAGAEVHYLTKKKFSSILECNPHIDKIHLLDANLSACIQQLKAENFDAVIDLHHNLRTLRIKLALGIKSYSFNKLNVEKWLLTVCKINRLPHLHIVDRYLATLSSFGVSNDGNGLDFFIAEKDRVSPESLPATHRKGYIGLVAGAAISTKRLPESKLSALCAMMPYPLVLLGGPEDADLGERLSANHSGVLNACGKYSLGQSADLVRQANVIISHDTGLMHIAAAFSRPIISIWGNTVPQFGMGPYFPGTHSAPSRIFEVPGLSCRPCSKIGFKKCPKKHFRCMNLQNLDEIVSATQEFYDYIPGGSLIK